MLFISVMLMSGCSSSSPSDSQNVITDDGVVPDPLVQNSTVVGFDITVPAYVSDSLQVRLVWGDRDIRAQWVGDEFWSVSEDFPTNTEHLLVVTFYDGIGDVTLASFEQDFITGTSDFEAYTITADQFNTDRWDNDSDGVSNINDSFPGTEAPESARVLLFSETRDFRHSSIEIALGALEELVASASLQTDRADDSLGVFTDANLANYDAVVWVMTSGDVLNADEQAAFERYIRSGGGYAGIHAASFTEYEWPWYGALVGAYFDNHPVVQSAIQFVEDSSHPSTAHLRSTWTRIDEWYDYRTNPRAQVNVLLRLDEGSYSGGTMGDDHPSAWYHDYDGGRSWYTGGGHSNDSYSEPDFRAHLLGGLRYAAGLGE
ncbi:MAG: type 1 glutamine amidotransferase [Halioglobus sp.]|jgi:type 1 glutamine amidotransferase